METEFAITLQESIKKNNSISQSFLKLPTSPNSLLDSKINSRVFDKDLNTYVYGIDGNTSEENNILLLSNFIQRYGLQEAIDECHNLINTHFTSYKVSFELKKDLETENDNFFMYIFSSLSIPESSQILLNILKRLSPNTKKSVRKFINIVNRRLN